MVGAKEARGFVMINKKKIAQREREREKGGKISPTRWLPSVASSILQASFFSFLFGTIHCVGNTRGEIFILF